MTAAKVAGALRLEPDTSVPGVDLVTFAAGIDADVVYDANADTVATIVVAAARAKPTLKDGNSDRGGTGIVRGATATGGPANATDPAPTPTPASSSDTGGSDNTIGMGATIAIAGAALLVLCCCIAACCCKGKGKTGGNRPTAIKYETDPTNNKAARATLARMGGRAPNPGSGSQVQGVSMRFANAAFEKPLPQNDGSGLYEPNTAPTYEIVPDGDGTGGPDPRWVSPSPPFVGHSVGGCVCACVVGGGGPDAVCLIAATLGRARP